MKKRNLYLMSFPLLLAATFATSFGVLRWQNERFEASSKANARESIETQLELTVAFFRPLFETNDLETLDRYCATLANERRSVAVFDVRGAAIVASDDADLRSPLNEPEVVDALRFGRGVVVRRDERTRIQTACAAQTLRARSKTLFVRIVVPKEEAAELNETETSALVVLLIGFPSFTAFVCYLIRRVARPLDRLQRNAEKIASGTLDVAIAIPNAGPIRELAQSVSEMARRLQKEVESVRRQEKFRSDFVANVSHEIKTPLAGIQSAIQILDDGGWNNPAYLAKCRDVLSKQTRRLQTLVHDVLTLAELERAEEDAATFEPVAFDAVVRSATQICAESTGDGSAKPQLKRIERLVVRGDARRLEQATLNLLTNAAKYGGDVPFEISLERRGDEARLVVRDFGDGVPNDEAEHIFERFFRIRKEYGRRDGSGLGLAIVRQIAKLHRGTVELEPTDGRGATFVLSIPLASDLSALEVDVELDT